MMTTYTRPSPLFRPPRRDPVLHARIATLETVERTLRDEMQRAGDEGNTAGVEYTLTAMNAVLLARWTLERRVAS